jgi:hypothetical protein
LIDEWIVERATWVWSAVSSAAPSAPVCSVACAIESKGSVGRTSLSRPLVTTLLTQENPLQFSRSERVLIVRVVVERDVWHLALFIDAAKIRLALGKLPVLLRRVRTWTMKDNLCRNKDD